MLYEDYILVKASEQHSPSFYHYMREREKSYANADYFFSNNSRAGAVANGEDKVKWSVVSEKRGVKDEGRS